MKLKTNVLKRIAESNRVKALLSIEFDKSSFTIDKWVADNKEDGPLTTTKAVRTIGEELQLTDSQILEETKKQNA